MPVMPIGFDKKRAQTIMEERDIDAIIAYSPENVFYTTGLPVLHSASNPVSWNLRKHFPTLSITPKESDQTIVGFDFAAVDAPVHSWVADVRVCARVRAPHEEYKMVKDVLEKKGCAKGNIGIEGDIPWYVYEELRSLLPDAKLIKADDIFWELRLIKSDEEIRRLRKATEICEKAMLAVFENVKEGVTTSELQRIAKLKAIEQGASGSYHMSQSADKPLAPVARGTQPDIFPDYLLGKGDMVSVDFGIVYSGYTSDMHRVAVLGKLPEELNKLFEIIYKMTEESMEKIRPGVKISEIFNTCQEAFKKEGYLTPLRNLGHSIGIEVEEPPFIRPETERTFEPNMVFCVELGYSHKGSKMICLEDTGVTTKKGFERFSTMDRELYIRS